MKNVLRFTLGVFVLATMFIACSEDDDNNSGTTGSGSTTSSTGSTGSTGSTTSSTGGGTGNNYFITGGTTINFTITDCEHTADTFFSEVVPVSIVSGIAANGSYLNAKFFRGQNAVASGGRYFTVTSSSLVQSGKVYINGMDMTRGEMINSTADKSITLVNQGGVLSLEFTNVDMTAVGPTFNGTRQISAKYGCN